MRSIHFAFFAGRHEKLKIMLAALVLIFLRSPRLLISGRVFAEEGTVYLKDAWDSPVLAALFATHQGYYSLLDNLVALFAARVTPLSWAAFLFTFGALLVLLLLVYLVISCEVFETTEARVLAALICVISPSLEVWLTLEDAQFCLAACVAIVLLSESETHRLPRYFAIVLGGLTGPLSCALVPFAWLRVGFRRTWNSALQALVLSACAVVEGLCVLHALHQGSRALAPGEKLAWIGPMFVMKILSVTFGTRLSFFALVHLLLQHHGPAILVLMWVIGMAGLIVLLHLARSGPSSTRWLFAISCWLFLFAYAGIGEPIAVLIGGASRYFYAPDLLLWLMILIVWQKTRSDSQPEGSARTRRLLIFLVFSGVLDSAGYWSKDQVIAMAWRPQVAHWRNDPSTPIVISPGTWQERLYLAPRDDR